MHGVEVFSRPRPARGSRESNDEEVPMARPPTGSIVERRGKHGITYGLRFRAGGRRYYLTGAATSRAAAELELQNALADVRRGIWKPPRRAVVVEVVEEPTFHLYASGWVDRRRHEVDRRTVEHWRWGLAHLLEHMHEHRPSQITGRVVDAYTRAKLREREAIDAAHAKGERLAGKPRRTWLELDEVRSLIDAGGKHRALLATMILAGLRVSELIALRWRDVDLAIGRLHVTDSKTDAGRRTVDLSPDLRDELLAHKAKAGWTDSTDFVFATRNGTARQRSNISRQILAPAITKANAARVKAGLLPIKSAVTNHSLRRTFASLLYEAGASPAYVMAQMGHESSALALEVYAKVMERKREIGARMDELVRGATVSLGMKSEFVADLEPAAAAFDDQRA
jgi:integrase